MKIEVGHSGWCCDKPFSSDRSRTSYVSRILIEPQGEAHTAERSASPLAILCMRYAPGCEGVEGKLGDDAPDPFFRPSFRPDF